MNWPRGAWRVWIILSVMWDAFVIFAYWWDFVMTPGWVPFPNGWRDAALGALLVFLPLILVPWLLTAVVLGIRWVVAGFRVGSSN
jgi:hypothetical protein